jgi:hypothetical protein
MSIDKGEMRKYTGSSIDSYKRFMFL